jgi:hypothetical protein
LLYYIRVELSIFPYIQNAYDVIERFVRRSGGCYPGIARETERCRGRFRMWGGILLDRVREGRRGLRKSHRDRCPAIGFGIGRKPGTERRHSKHRHEARQSRAAVRFRSR